MHSHGSSNEDAPDDSRDPASRDRPGGPAVFRIPLISYAVVVCLTAIVLVPVVNWPARAGWLLIVPAALLWWVARVRTAVTGHGVEVRTSVGRRAVPWRAVRGIVFPHPRVFGISWARAHLADGDVVRLPAVTWNDIPRVSRASGGRIPDPIVPRERAQSEHITEDPGDAEGSAGTAGLAGPADAADSGDAGDTDRE